MDAVEGRDEKFKKIQQRAGGKGENQIGQQNDNLPYAGPMAGDRDTQLWCSSVPRLLLGASGASGETSEHMQPATEVTPGALALP